MPRHPTFDRLFQQGCDAIAAGTHQRQVPPTDDGPRWGTSVILRPDAAAAARIDSLTQLALAAAGSGHWATGSIDASHITVRALERHRTHIPREDLLLTRYAAALAAAAGNAQQIRFTLQGVTLTPNSVMLCAQAIGDAADDFAQALEGKLGADGWLEADRPRDIWYLTLVHFAGPVVHAVLADWVSERRELLLGTTAIDTAEIVGFHYDGRRVSRGPALASARLGAS